MYKALSDVYSDEQVGSTSALSINFSAEFHRNLKDHQGNALSVERFEQDYDSLMSDWNK